MHLAAEAASGSRRYLLPSQRPVDSSRVGKNIDVESQGTTAEWKRASLRNRAGHGLQGEKIRTRKTLGGMAKHWIVFRGSFLERWNFFRIVAFAEYFQFVSRHLHRLAHFIKSIRRFDGLDAGIHGQNGLYIPFTENQHWALTVLAPPSIAPMGCCACARPIANAGQVEMAPILGLVGRSRCRHAERPREPSAGVTIPR